jgi:ABC-type Fe3+-citrate transport system substrate-binding protein
MFMHDIHVKIFQHTFQNVTVLNNNEKRENYSHNLNTFRQIGSLSGIKRTEEKYQVPHEDKLVDVGTMHEQALINTLQRRSRFQV